MHDQDRMHFTFTNCTPLLHSTNPILPMSPPVSRTSSPDLELNTDLDALFDPQTSDLKPENSVLLSIDTIPAYLDRALKALDLHVEARTSFIT